VATSWVQKFRKFLQVPTLRPTIIPKTSGYAWVRGEVRESRPVLRMRRQSDPKFRTLRTKNRSWAERIAPAGPNERQSILKGWGYDILKGILYDSARTGAMAHQRGPKFGTFSVNRAVLASYGTPTTQSRRTYVRPNWSKNRSILKDMSSRVERYHYLSASSNRSGDMNFWTERVAVCISGD